MEAPMPNPTAEAAPTTFHIRNLWTGAIQFFCELSAEVAAQRYGLQLGFAVKKALDTHANLSGANLSGANLSGANLSDANLRGVKADFLAEVLRLPNELEALCEALIAAFAAEHDAVAGAASAQKVTAKGAV
jgi:hypothetical protein